MPDYVLERDDERVVISTDEPLGEDELEAAQKKFRKGARSEKVIAGLGARKAEVRTPAESTHVTISIEEYEALQALRTETHIPDANQGEGSPDQ